MKVFVDKFCGRRYFGRLPKGNRNVITSSRNGTCPSGPSEAGEELRSRSRKR